VEADPYTLSGSLCELVLLERGWHAVFLGPNMPLASFANAIDEKRPRLAWLCINYLADEARFLRDFEAFCSTVRRHGVALVLGGHAVESGLRARLGSAICADRLSNLDELARHIQPNRSPASDSDHVAG
jgi:methanogenic corrinoid protein MtbC1